MKRNQRGTEGNPLWPTTTVIQSRVPMFLPTKVVPAPKGKRPMIVEAYHETPWGSVTISGPVLTQVHRNILDLVFSRFNASALSDESGQTRITVDPYRLQKALGVTPTSHTWLLRKLNELAEVKLVIVDFRRRRTTVCRVLDAVTFEHPHTKNERPARARLALRQTYFLRFSPEFMHLYREDIRVKYLPLVGAILQLRHAINQALVRFCLTHSNVNCWALDHVLVWLGASRAGMSRRSVRRIKQHVRAEAATLRAAFGIRVENDRVSYTQHDVVYVEDPAK